MTDQQGNITMVLGPMFSGKSTYLLNHVRKLSYTEKKVIFVNYAEDKRYDDNASICTHEHEKIQALACHTLEEVMNVLKTYDVIGIDEAQFFSDLVPSCEKLCSEGKIIVCAGLSGDFKMEPFPNIASLISKADKIKFLKAVCAFCHKDALFSLRTVKCDKTILIGSSESYKPVCRACYYSHGRDGKKEEKPETV